MDGLDVSRDGWNLVERRGERFDASLKQMLVIDDVALNSMLRNFEHANPGGRPGLPVRDGDRIIGRIRKLEVRADGLWAFIRWLKPNLSQQRN